MHIATICELDPYHKSYTHVFLSDIQIDISLTNEIHKYFFDYFFNRRIIIIILVYVCMCISVTIYIYIMLIKLSFYRSINGSKNVDQL